MKRLKGIEKPVSDSSDASMEQAQMWTAESSDIKAMQEMKAREVEHVRWRAAQPPVLDPELQCVVHSMRTDARKQIQTRVDLAELSISPPGSASVDPHDFLQARHKENLQVTDLPKLGTQGAELREQYCELLKRFPQTTILKVGEEQMRTDIGRAKAVVQLVSKHAGEIVEFDRTEMGWILHPLAPPGFASGTSVEWSQQWNCKEDGHPVDTPKDIEYGYTKVMDSVRKMNEQVEFVVKRYSGVGKELLVPHWEAQTLRTVVPCVGTDAYEWRRVGQVVTLGTLFMVLGKKWPASSIYYLYCTLRIVATKKRKDHRSIKRGDLVRRKSLSRK
jgi:hypothetical protein